MFIDVQFDCLSKGHDSGEQHYGMQAQFRGIA